MTAPLYTPTQRLKIFARANGRCENPACGVKLDPKNWEADHFHPRWLKGKSTISNGKALCPECHSRKSKGDTRNFWHVKRLRGETGSRKRENARKRKLARLKRETERIERMG